MTVPVLPSRRPVYNAGSAVTVKWNSRDENLGELELTTLRYRVDNLTDSRIVLDWTNIATPDPAGSKVIPAALNGMATTYRSRQLMQVTFEMTDADGNLVQDVQHYVLAAVYQGATA